MNVLTVKMPSLRESREDIEGLAVYFLNMFNRKYNKNKYLSDHVLQNFVQYSWRGNVRELESLIERLEILSEDEVIEEKDLPQKMREQNIVSGLSHISNQKKMPKILKEMEKKMIIDVLEKNSTRKSAKFLSIMHY